MAEDDVSNKNELADKSDRLPSYSKDQKDEVEIVDPIPAEESSEEDHAYVKSDPDVEASFYVSAFVLDFLEQRRGQKNVIHALLALQDPVTPIPSRSLLPTTNPQTYTQKSSPSPAEEFQFAVPRGRAPRRRLSSAPRTPPPVPPPSPTQTSIPLLSSLLGLFSHFESSSESPSQLLPLLLGSESSTVPPDESITLPNPLDAPSSPPVSINPNINLSPSKRLQSPSSNFKLEACDRKKLRRLIPDDAIPGTSSSDEASKPGVLLYPLSPQVYPYLLNLSEAYEVTVETVFEAIKFDQYGPHDEKSGLYVPVDENPQEKRVEEKNGPDKTVDEKPTEKPVEEKNGPDKTVDEKPTEKQVEEKNGPDNTVDEKPAEKQAEEKNGPDKTVDEKPTEKQVEETNGLYNPEQNKHTEKEATISLENSCQARKGGPYKNKPAS